jgi:hypothetical protein
MLLTPIILNASAFAFVGKKKGGKENVRKKKKSSWVKNSCLHEEACFLPVQPMEKVLMVLKMYSYPWTSGKAYSLCMDRLRHFRRLSRRMTTSSKAPDQAVHPPFSCHC